MKKFLLVSFFLLISIASAAITSGRLVYLNGSTATLYYDTSSSSYKDSSVTNPNVYAELCADSASDLLGNFTALYYRSGAINKSISLIPANITSVNASNCAKVDVDTSIYRAYYPGVLSVGFSNSESMDSPTFYDLSQSNGLLSGTYKYSDASNSTNTIIKLDKIYYSGSNEITTDKPYLIVALYNSTSFINSTLIKKSENAVFPLATYTYVKVNNLTASLTQEEVQQPTGGGGEGPPRKSLSLSIATSGYVGDEITFTVVDDDGDPVRNALVKVKKIGNGNEITVAKGETDKDGTYKLTIEDEGNYYAIASKGGYDESNKEYFMLWKRSLTISSKPKYIYVENPISIFVKDYDTEAPLEGSAVTLYSPAGVKIKTCYTDENGECEFSAENFAEDGEYGAVAGKKYYNNNTLMFNVYLYPLEVSHPSDVYTRETFSVEVRSLGRPVSGASVIFDGNSYVTDEEGRVREVSFQEPGAYSITVEKRKYQTYESAITAANPPIYPLYPKEMYSKEPFTIILTSPDKECISDAEVRIGDYIFYSDAQGMVEVWVENPNNYTVAISKDGCSPRREITEITERPPEKIFEKGVVGKQKAKVSSVEVVAEQLGLQDVIKSGCTGIYIEGIPAVVCDLIWVVVAVGAAASAAASAGNLKKLVYGFTPVIVAVASIPAAGAAVGIVAFALSYKSWVDERARKKMLKEKEERIARELEEGRGIEEIIREEEAPSPPAAEKPEVKWKDEGEDE